MLFLLIVINIGLAAIAVTFAIRNIFINYKESKSKLKNASFIISLVITIGLTLMVGTNVLFFDMNLQHLESSLSMAESTTVVGKDGEVINQSATIREEISTIKHQEPKAALYTALGFLFLACSWQLRKSIIKEIDETKTTGTWNL